MVRIKLTVAAVAAVAAVGLSGCGTAVRHAGAPRTCLVNGYGNTLCNGTAAAWCQATQEMRDQAQDDGASGVESTIALCNRIVSEYGG